MAPQSDRPAEALAWDRARCLELDRTDSLAFTRERFALPEGLIYLDGNSLGAMPVGVPARVEAVLRDEWSRGLIGSWNAADWIGLPARLGGRIAALVGAAEDEVLVADSTSINVFKLLVGALRVQADRRVVLTEAGNFPTDRYMLDGAIELLGQGHACRALEAPADEDSLIAAMGADTAVAVLTQVDYRSGRCLDMARVNAAAAAAGCLVLWDLAHSAGALPVDLSGSGAQLAVGCTYKYLNGGPGAPAFLYVARSLQSRLPSSLPGWLGHAEPFRFEPSYRPAPGLRRQLVGTPPVVAMAALDAALDAWQGVDLHELRRKSLALTSLFIDLVEARLGAEGGRLISPREPARRGSQVSFAHPRAFPIIQALIDRGVVGDFREPDILRFGFAPLYLRHVDVWDAVERWAGVFADGAHLDPRYQVRGAVT